MGDKDPNALLDNREVYVRRAEKPEPGHAWSTLKHRGDGLGVSPTFVSKRQHIVRSDLIQSFAMITTSSRMICVQSLCNGKSAVMLVSATAFTATLNQVLYKQEES